MKKIMKHILALTLIVALLSTVAIPVFAAETNVTPRSSYSSGKFKLGGKEYNYTASIGASTTSGAYTYLYVKESVDVSRRHLDLTVVFDTSNSGYRTATGGYRDITCQHASQSYTVTYAPGMSYVIGYRSAKGSILIFGDTTYTVEVNV